MKLKQLLVFILIFIGITAIHVTLNFWVFPRLEAPYSELLKLTYEGVALGLYNFVGYLILFFTKESLDVTTAQQAKASKGTTSPLLQALLLALILYVGLRFTQALVSIFITIFDDLRINGEITGATSYGMSVIDRTLSGYLFLFTWLPLCIYSVLRLTRKLGRNPGFTFFLFVSLTVLFASIFTNFQTSNEWAQALVQTLAPIFGSAPESIHPRDVGLFIVVQSLGTIVFSILLALFMWSISALRQRFGNKLDQMGI